MTPKQMIKILQENGFECIRQNGSHMFFKNFTTGKTTTVPFHSSKELKKGTENNILKLAGLK